MAATGRILGRKGCSTQEFSLCGYHVMLHQGSLLYEETCRTYDELRCRRRRSRSDRSLIYERPHCRLGTQASEPQLGPDGNAGSPPATGSEEHLAKVAGIVCKSR